MAGVFDLTICRPLAAYVPQPGEMHIAVELAVSPPPISPTLGMFALSPMQTLGA